LPPFFRLFPPFLPVPGGLSPASRGGLSGTFRRFLSDPAASFRPHSARLTGGFRSLSARPPASFRTLAGHHRLAFRLARRQGQRL